MNFEELKLQFLRSLNEINFKILETHDTYRLAHVSLFAKNRFSLIYEEAQELLREVENDDSTSF
jgi:hypothetical protein